MNRFTKIILSRLMFLSLLTSYTSFSQVLCMEDKKEVDKEGKKKKKNKNKNKKVSKSDEQSNQFFDCDNVKYDSAKSLKTNVSIIFDQISNSIKHCLKGIRDNKYVFAKPTARINNINNHIYSKLTKNNENTLGKLLDKFFKFDIKTDMFGSIEISCVIYNALLLLQDAMQGAKSKDFLDVHYVHVRDGLPLLDFSNFAQSLNGDMIFVDEGAKTYKSEDIDVVLYRLNNGEWKVADGLKQLVLIQSIRRYAANNNNLYQNCISKVTDCFSKQFGCSLDPEFGFLGVPAEAYFKAFTLSPLSYVFDPDNKFDDHDLPYPFGYNDCQAQIVKNFLFDFETNKSPTLFDKCLDSINPDARFGRIPAWRAFGKDELPAVYFPVLKENYDIPCANSSSETITVYRNIPDSISKENSSLYKRPRFIYNRTRNRSADCRFRARRYY